MSDTRLRELERAAATGDPSAAEVLRAACARAGHVRTGYAVFMDDASTEQGERCPRCAEFVPCPPTCVVHDHMSLAPEAMRLRLAQMVADGRIQAGGLVRVARDGTVRASGGSLGVAVDVLPSGDPFVIRMQARRTP